MTLRMLWMVSVAGKIGWIAMGLVVLRILLPVLVGDIAGAMGIARGLFTTNILWGFMLLTGGLGVYFSRYPGLLEPEGRPYLVGLSALIVVSGIGIAVGSPTLAAGGVLLFCSVAWLWLRRCDRLSRERRIGATITPVIVHESHDRIRAVIGGRHLV
jgi:hypothetical protein